MLTGKRAHRNPRNLFVLNLVISGLLTSALCLPPTLLQCLHTGQWLLGVAACKIVPAIQGEQQQQLIISQTQTMTVKKTGLESFCFNKQRSGRLTMFSFISLHPQEPSPWSSREPSPLSLSRGGSTSQKINW